MIEKLPGKPAAPARGRVPHRQRRPILPRHRFAHSHFSVNFFITGTDTGVGKTYVTCLLIRALRQAGRHTIGLKPICCGDRTDAELLHAAADAAIDLNDVNPLWFRFPASPYTASIVESRQPDLDQIRERYARLRAVHPSILIEGVGGWQVPIRRDFFVSDLAVEFALPVLVVAANRLGMLNHTLLTVAAVERAGLRCAGVIVNNLPNYADSVTATNRSVLEELVEVPVLSEVNEGQSDLSTVVSALSRD